MIAARSLSVLVCDGCTAEYVGGSHQNAVTVRATAYADGWRFPNQVDAKGSQLPRSNSDVCPDCIGAWVPAVWRSKP